MSRVSASLACLLALAAACRGKPDGGDASGEAPSAEGRAGPRSTSGLVEGKDYVVLERVRILDEQGFDQPVEAMSVLLPRGWRTESGVRWKSVNECRGEMITWQMSSTSPDGQIRFTVLPVRSFSFSQDRMLQQSLLAASRQGGCPVSPPFDAQQYLTNLARTELGGATVSEVRADEAMRPILERSNAQANATSRQYGTGMHQTGSAVVGTLAWPDGTKGIANVGVIVMSKQGQDLYGQPNGFATTTVFHQVVMRFPPEREAEAVKHFGTILASHRVNPAWQQAKDGFLTRLGNIEHAGRMERLRLQGEASRAYARARGEAMDAQMRDWERRQASSDANQHRFVQTIREVETWKDPNGGPVELGAGYSHGWSRPDGTIILTNNSLFNPAVELQQNWSKMEKVRQ